MTSREPLRDTRETLREEWVYVCLACGKIKGEHRGWDVSCEIHCGRFRPEALVRGEHGRVAQILDNVGMGYRRAFEAEA